MNATCRTLVWWTTAACLGTPQSRPNTTPDQIEIDVPDLPIDDGSTGSDSDTDALGDTGAPPPQGVAPELDLGAVAEGCEATVVSVPAADRLPGPVEVTSFAWSPTDPGDQGVLTVSFLPGLPAQLDRSSGAVVDLLPVAVGAPRQVSGRIVAVTSTGDTVVLRRVTLAVEAPALQTWTRAAAPPPALDLALVLSDRLEDAKYWESTLIAGELSGFVDTLVRWEVPFAVTTVRSTDPVGARVGATVVPTTPDPALALLANVARVHRGSARTPGQADPIENVLESATASLTSDVAREDFADVVRPGSDVVVVMVSASDHRAGEPVDTDPDTDTGVDTDLPPDTYVLRAMAALAGSHPHRYVGALAGPGITLFGPPTCTTLAGTVAEQAPRVRFEFVSLGAPPTVGARVRDICAKSLSTVFEDVLLELYGRQDAIAVPQGFDTGGARTVRVDGVVVPSRAADGWTYDGRSSVLSFAPSAVPGPGALIELTWADPADCPD